MTEVKRTGHHYIKCETEYYQAIESGEKTFEIRKNDRDYRKWDVLHLLESVNGVTTGRCITRDVKYIMHGGQFGLDKDYCIMAIGGSDL